MEGLMRPGPKPKPTLIRELHGSKLPKNPLEPIPKGDLTAQEKAACPAHYDAEQRDCWEYALRHAPPGLLKLIDASVLNTWVVAHCLHVRASRDLQNRSLFIRQGPQIIPNPLLSIINKQALVILRAADMLGFTPTARPRINGNIAAEQLTPSYGRPEKDAPTRSLEEFLDNAPRSAALN